MRPRVFPAEDAAGGRHETRAGGDRFNEAAGIPRGRLGTADDSNVFGYTLQ